MRILAILLLSVSGQCLAQLSDTLRLKDYQPQSIYKIPITQVTKARFKVVDMHSHAYAESTDQIAEWIQNMDQFGIEKTVLLTYASGSTFDSLVRVYKPYSARFELWCGIDFTGYKEPNWSQKAIKELERCKKLGAKGIGELGDKGKGLIYSSSVPALGMHLDDDRMIPVLQAAGRMKLPVNIHVAEPKWMYEPIDVHNDGLMNAGVWQIDTQEPGVLTHAQLINTLENAVKQCPGTTFIACHFANCSYDLSVLGRLLDQYPNLYADISARFAETAAIPRHTAAFYEKYQDRLLFGTDNGFGLDMYEVVFRILETADEHFYFPDFNYHWSLSGFDLSDEILRKLYHENAETILH